MAYGYESQAVLCVDGRWDPDGRIPYENVQDFIAMCREVHGETPLPLVPCDEGWRDAHGDLVLVWEAP